MKPNQQSIRLFRHALTWEVIARVKNKKLDWPQKGAKERKKRATTTKCGYMKFLPFCAFALFAAAPLLSLRRIREQTYSKVDERFDLRCRLAVLWIHDRYRPQRAFVPVL